MPTFAPNATVRLITQRDQIGTIRGEPNRVGGEDWYRVLLGNGRVQKVPERNLEPYEGPQDVETLLRKGAFATREALSRLITISKIQRPLSNNLYSFQASRTEFQAHQLKAVLKYLDSPKSRLLIADEVGLGKTIEAGLILAEERARQDLERVLVVCPSALRQKWQKEMREKFDEDFELLDAARMREFVDRFEEQGGAVRLRGIVSLQTLRGEDLLDAIAARPPHFDLAIVDEAHHMRNPDTFSHAAGQLLSECADSMILLTATPVHLGNENLFYLLRLLDPEEFDELAAFDRRLRANVHVINAFRILARHFPADLAACGAELRRVEQTHERDRFLRNPLYQDAARRLAVFDGSRRDQVIELQRAIAGLNLLGHVFTRTRKAEIHEVRPVRNARALRKEFSARESELYTAIGAFARNWYNRRSLAVGHGGSVINAESFAAIMLKRQAASSLPALVEGTLERANNGEVMTETDWGPDLAGEEVGDEALRQVVSIREDPAFQALVTEFRDIETVDSKYAALLDGLRGLDREQPDEKLVVFSFFKGTLRYLHRRLSADGYRCILVHGDVPSDPRDPDRDERGKRFREFEMDPRVRILLSSEVGSEGLDLQFCHIVVNYDLPWNPMVVEQRIGRLDRFGQRSRTVLIINFSIPGTIEDRILHRLYDRIRIFEESVGDLEPILGSEILDLERKLLSGELTTEQQEAEIERVASVLERQRQELKALEGDSERLLGHDEYFYEELERVRRLGRYVSADELRLLVDGFLVSRFPRSTLTDTLEEGVLLLTAPPDLVEFVRRQAGPLDSLTMAFLARAARPLRVTFQATVAYGNREIEFLAVHHPLIRAIARHYRDEPSGLHPATKVAIRTAEVPPGLYLFLLHLLEVKGVRERLQFEPVFVSFDGRARVDRASGEALLSVMVTQGETLAVDPDLSEDQAAELIRQADGLFSERLAELQADLQRTNDALAENRLASIEASYRIKLARQRQRLQPPPGRQRDPRYVRMVEGTIRRLEGELDVKRRQIEEARRLDLRDEVLAGGVVEVSRQ